MKLFTPAVLAISGLLLCYHCTCGYGQDNSDQRPRTFGADDGIVKFQGFGNDVVVVSYTASDLERAEGLIARYDKNRDRMLDADEINKGAAWRFREWHDFDFNRDGRLSVIEMAQRQASRTNGDGPSPPVKRYSVIDQLRREAAAPVAVETRRRSVRGNDGNRRSRELAYDIMSRFDRNQDRQLDSFERKDLGIDVSRIDENGDDLIDGSELYQWIDSQIDEKVGDLSDVLPDWFFEKDANSDQQVSMAEFTDNWSDELLDQFNSMDTNHDGVITAIELAEAKSVIGGTYTSAKATLISPRTTATSMIEVDDDILIEKLRVQLSITHDYTEQISAYIKTPDGKRIDLFRSVGGSGDHFEATIFDDESGDRIQRATAPFRGTYQPIAVEKGEPSLNSLQDTSLKGQWQLVIDADRNQRFGILHSWALLVVPRKQKTLPGEALQSENVTAQ